MKEFGLEIGNGLKIEVVRRGAPVHPKFPAVCSTYAGTEQSVKNGVYGRSFLRKWLGGNSIGEWVVSQLSNIGGIPRCGSGLRQDLALVTIRTDTPLVKSRVIGDPS